MANTEDRLIALESSVRGIQQQLMAQHEDLVRRIADAQFVPEDAGPPPVRLLSPEEAKQFWLRGLPDWQPEAEYIEGEIVKHTGRTWMALPDVAVGYAPDDDYDAAARTGGWLPFDPYLED